MKIEITIYNGSPQAFTTSFDVNEDDFEGLTGDEIKDYIGQKSWGYAMEHHIHVDWKVK